MSVPFSSYVPFGLQDDTTVVLTSTSALKGVPDKGKILTKISLFWFNKLNHVIPTHFVTANIDEMPEGVWQYREQLEGRTMLVKKARVIPLEAIVRGYLTGLTDMHTVIMCY